LKKTDGLLGVRSAGSEVAFIMGKNANNNKLIQWKSFINGKDEKKQKIDFDL
jgi:hypothetical protein